MTKILDLVRRNEIDLVLVGKTAGHQNSGFLPEKLARKAPCSVLVVPEGTPATISNLLVAAEFSDDSADAMEAAIAIARAVPLSAVSTCNLSRVSEWPNPHRLGALLRRHAGELTFR